VFAGVLIVVCVVCVCVCDVCCVCELWLLKSGTTLISVDKEKLKKALSQNILCSHELKET
jgi:hypothetical protein